MTGNVAIPASEHFAGQNRDGSTQHHGGGERGNQSGQHPAVYLSVGGAAGIATDAAITVTFSEPMDAATISTRHV
jgi:hypothetical protein